MLELLITVDVKNNLFSVEAVCSTVLTLTVSERVKGPLVVFEKRVLLDLLNAVSTQPYLPLTHRQVVFTQCASAHTAQNTTLWMKIIPKNRKKHVIEHAFLNEST